ncbi:hypothetical protein J5N97_017427 [Dioscorea zingiberensis]|uniref:protein disulfide-isomerase n=1 Tax=Dioscorea zingiberensis TaxID=325984 RepID=A0A9D5CN59_9LILI|nr:hypothetical protein J5N97_017427 [Dioscorea zingiberensis]
MESDPLDENEQQEQPRSSTSNRNSRPPRASRTSNEDTIMTDIVQSIGQMAGSLKALKKKNWKEKLTKALDTLQGYSIQHMNLLCGHCKTLAHEYEKAATILSKHEPPVIFAKVDANEEANKELASKYEVKAFLTLKILRNKGKSIQDYKGSREADGIVEYLKNQVGVFPEFSGKEYENFMDIVAEKLCSDYDFGRTSDAKFLPRGDSTVKHPKVRLFKSFDELLVDTLRIFKWML